MTNVFLDAGPASIESEYDDALAVPGILAKVRQAAEDGVDAIVINCMADPGLRAAREAVFIPVIGPCEASKHLGAMLGRKFSVLAVLDRLVPQFEDRATVYGVKDKLASVRSVEFPVLEMEEDRERLSAPLVEQAVKAVQEDGAHVIILGCTGMMGLALEVEGGLKERGCPVPVIEPAIVALKTAEAQIDLGLSHSKKTYPYPQRRR